MTPMDEAIANLEDLLPTLRRKSQRVQVQKSIDLIKEPGPSSTIATTETVLVEPTIGRGLLRPTTFYGDEAEEVCRALTLVEGLQSILSYPDSLNGEDIGRIERASEYLLEKVEVLKNPTHNLNPVGELRWIADVLSAMHHEDKLPSHVRYDLVNIVSALEELIAGHVAEPVDHKDAKGGVRLVHRFEHTVERLAVCAEAHPMDISQRDLRDAVLYLRSIHQNNRGWENLGKEGYVLVSTTLHEDVADAISPLLIAYGEGRHRARDLRAQAAFQGSPAMALMPQWFIGTYGHTSKGSFTRLLHHIMLEGQLTPVGNLPVVYFGTQRVKELEAEVEAGNRFAYTHFIKDSLEGDDDE